MKKIITLFALAILATPTFIYAQYSGDALRFSQTNYGSSARFKAMGNAQIGVGGDISSISGNPAGLGLFTKSEFVFTPELNMTNIDANFLNNNTKTDRTQINLNQLGVVFQIPTYKQKGQDAKKGIVSATLGLGYTRNNDYGLEANYSGINRETSVYNAFNDYSVAPNSTQAVNVTRAGSVSEFNLAGALNISNQIYVGAALGIVSLRYDYSSNLEEDGIAANYFINYNQDQFTKGTGINLKFGMIFRPVPELRLGANLQSPTWINVSDSYTESSNDPNILTSETYDFNYNLRTPLKGSLGASYIIGKTALLSADVDFIDYSTIRFTSGDGNDISIINNNNRDVRASYKSAINYRFGGELKLNDFFSLRAGYGLNGSAFKDDNEDLFKTQFYSGGLGFRNKSYYVDLAYQRIETTSTFSPYILSDFTEPVATSNNNKNNVFLTVGLRF